MVNTRDKTKNKKEGTSHKKIDNKKIGLIILVVAFIVLLFGHKFWGSAIFLFGILGYIENSGKIKKDEKNTEEIIKSNKAVYKNKREELNLYEKSFLIIISLIFILLIFVVPSPNKESKTKISKQEFSFDNYIKENEVRQYKIVKEEDLTIKVFGEKRLSEYTAGEIKNLPANIRKEYRIIVSWDITEEELKSTLAQCIENKSKENLNIDEIIVFAYDNEESIDGAYTLGKAKWCPEGEWANMTIKIARNNVRDNYKIIYNIKDLSSRKKVEYSLAEEKRKEIFWEFISLQDSVLFDDPQYAQKMQDSYGEIAKRYNIDEEIVREVISEGLEKRWPIPDSNN